MPMRTRRNEAPPSPQSIARWTLRLDNVLSNYEARRRFKRFLIEQDNSNALDTLYFLKECTKLKSSTDIEQSIEKVRELIGRIQNEELAVNIDGSLLARMFNIDDATSLQSTLSDAVTIITNEDVYLNEAYRDFCVKLTQSQ